MVAIMLDQLASMGWQKLGLQPDPMTGKMEASLSQAKAAIDAAAALAAILEPQLDESDRREVQNLIANLKINYVERSKENS